MTDTTQSAANGANGQASPGSEGSGAQPDDLDTLLNEFDRASEQQPDPTPGKKEAAEAPVKVDDDRLARAVMTIEDMELERVATSIKRDVAKAVEQVTAELSDLERPLPPRLVRGFLEIYASDDPRFRKAFQQRGQNPQAWGKILKAAARELRKELTSQPDKQATDDRDAVTAAVRSASTRSDTTKAPNFAAMSDKDFRAHKERLGG